MFSQKEANNLASLFLILCILFPLNNVNAQTDNSIFSVRKASLSKDVLEYSPIHLDNQWIYTQIDNEGVIMSSLGSNKNTPITGFNLRKSIVTGFAKSYQGGLIAISYGDTKTNVPTKLKNNKIWFAYQDKNGFASKYFEFALNSSNYSCTTPFISNDGTKLYFSSDKPGGYGGFDLYVCDYRGKEWSTPRNLGPIINTENDEVYPNLVDNILFFSSNGHGGARMDIFIADMGNDKGRLVINAGSPINSPADDYSMTFDNNTRTGYFLSDRDGVNGKVFEVTNEKKLLLINIKSNDDKKAISGAKLDLSRCKKNPMYANSKGSIILPMSIGENCFVQIGKVGYNATTLMIDYNEVVGLKKAVDIYLSEEGVFYKGKVTDENGGPAVEVELSIIDQATGELQYVFTDENGAYSAALEPLSFYLIRTKSLYFDQKETKFATLAEVPQTILGSIQLQSNGKKQSALQPINIDDIKVVEKTEPTNSQTSGNSVSDFVEVEATKKIENAKGPETNVSQAQKIMDENDKKASIETKPEVISSSDQPESVISDKPTIIEAPKENKIMEGVKYAIQLAAVSTDNTNLNPYIEKTQGKGQVYSVKEGNFNKIRLGFYETREDAIAMREKLPAELRKGFIVEVNKREAESVPKVILDEQKIINSTPKSMPKTIDTYNEPIITKVAEPKVEYKIRLSTLRDPKLFNGSKVKQYGLVEEVLTGNLVTFYLSGFENKEEAKEVIDNVKESGFPAAQIVKLMNGEYSIDN
ncbi:MAG: SPOR domain-containing protein [Saprospiraceae bacterium]|nr:SPOR domain-containing protein [Candidatus Brachybacter algidus]